jgi:hypothetical protein
MIIYINSPFWNAFCMENVLNYGAIKKVYFYRENDKLCKGMLFAFSHPICILTGKCMKLKMEKVRSWSLVLIGPDRHV